MSDKKVLSFDDLVAFPDVTLQEVEAKRGIVNIASCSSAEILEWFDENDALLDDGKPDLEKRRYKGLRLVVRCILNPDGSRIPREMRASAIAALKDHDSRENGRLMQAAFEVNGLRVVTKDEIKNALSETGYVASPTASPLPQAK